MRRFPTLSQFHCLSSVVISEEVTSKGSDTAGWTLPQADSALGNGLAGNTLSDFLTRERAMDWNRVEGNWKQVKGKVKEQWGKLPDDDLDVIAGKQDQLEGKLQERYGYAKDRAQREMNDWYRRQSW